MAVIVGSIARCLENKLLAQSVNIRDRHGFRGQAQGTARNVKGFALCVESLSQHLAHYRASQRPDAEWKFSVGKRLSSPDPSRVFILAEPR